MCLMFKCVPGHCDILYSLIGILTFQRALTASVDSCMDIKVPLTEFRGRCWKGGGGGGMHMFYSPRTVQPGYKWAREGGVHGISSSID